MRNPEYDYVGPEEEDEEEEEVDEVENFELAKKMLKLDIEAEKHRWDEHIEAIKFLIDEKKKDPER